jgi:hypothetical protein
LLLFVMEMRRVIKFWNILCAVSKGMACGMMK